MGICCDGERGHAGNERSGKNRKSLNLQFWSLRWFFVVLRMSMNCTKNCLTPYIKTSHCATKDIERLQILCTWLIFNEERTNWNKVLIYLAWTSRSCIFLNITGNKISVAVCFRPTLRWHVVANCCHVLLLCSVTLCGLFLIWNTLVFAGLLTPLMNQTWSWWVA